MPRHNVPDVDIDVPTLLNWTKGGFNSLGPLENRLARDGLELSHNMLSYAAGCTPERVKPGSWSDYLFGLASEGLIAMERAAADLRLPWPQP